MAGSRVSHTVVAVLIIASSLQSEEQIVKKRLLSVLLPLGLLLVAMPVCAGLRIGYVNAARLLDEAPQAKEATSRLKQEFAPREESLVEAGKALQKLQERMTRDAAIMSDEERKRLGLDIMARKRELQRNQDAFREDVNIRRNDAISQIQEIIKQAINEVGKQGHYDLIFYDGISYANPDLEITDKVLERLRAMHHGGDKNASKP